MDVPRGDIDPTGTVIRKIQEYDVEETIVRVLIKVPAELEGHLRDADVRVALDGAHYIAAISREVAEQARTRLGTENTQNLDPTAALKLYLDSREIEPKRARKLIDHAAMLMEDSGE